MEDNATEQCKNAYEELRDERREERHEVKKAAMSGFVNLLNKNSKRKLRNQQLEIVSKSEKSDQPVPLRYAELT